MALLLLFIWIDLPLARRSLKKGWRVYQLSKISGSLESLDRRIEEEKLRDDALAEKMMKSQMGQAAGSVSPVIDLINESARQSSISVVSVNSFPPLELNRFPFEISLQGKYHDLGHFLGLLENSGYAVRVHALTMSTKDAVSNELNAKMKLSVFFGKS